MDALAVLNRLDRMGPAVVIAQHLADLGCFGLPGSTAFCPIARYVTVESGELVDVTPDACVFVEDELDDDGFAPAVAIPWRVRSFIEEFDSGLHDELVGDPS